MFHVTALLFYVTQYCSRNGRTDGRPSGIAWLLLLRCMGNTLAGTRVSGGCAALTNHGATIAHHNELADRERRSNIVYNDNEV